jgi:hypothetical protein
LESEIADIDFVLEGIANPNLQESNQSLARSKKQGNQVSWLRWA